MGEEKQNKMAFEWISDTLEELVNAIDDVLDVSSNLLLDDVAIIPVESNQFEFIENNKYLIGLLEKLGFIAPNKYLGTCWWRVPREFKTTDIRNMVELIKEAIKLPFNADLRTLCALNQNEEIMDIALLNEDSNDNSNRFESESKEEQIENEQMEQNMNGEQSESDQEYKVQAVSEINDENLNEEELENDERKRKKKEK